MGGKSVRRKRTVLSRCTSYPGTYKVSFTVFGPFSVLSRDWSRPPTNRCRMSPWLRQRLCGSWVPTLLRQKRLFILFFRPAPGLHVANYFAFPWHVPKQYCALMESWWLSCGLSKKVDYNYYSLGNSWQKGGSSPDEIRLCSAQRKIEKNRWPKHYRMKQRWKNGFQVLSSANPSNEPMRLQWRPWNTLFKKIEDDHSLLNN